MEQSKNIQKDLKSSLHPLQLGTKEKYINLPDPGQLVRNTIIMQDIPCVLLG